MQFTVGLKANGKAEHAVVDAEDALVAALKVKMQRPDAEILYVRARTGEAIRGIRRTRSGRSAEAWRSRRVAVLGYFEDEVYARRVPARRHDDGFPVPVRQLRFVCGLSRSDGSKCPDR
jgi:hypothetical protein